MILRRRDDYQRVLRELGGQLFARKGNVDKYFYTRPKIGTGVTAMRVNSDFDKQANRVRLRVQEHIRSAPEREAVALRAANESYKSKFAYVAWGSRAGIERLWRTRG